MQRPYSPTIRRRRLGFELRRLREEHGFTLDDAAKRSGVPRATIGKIETAESRRTRARDLDALADLYNLDEEGRAGLHQLSRESKEKGWWSRYKDVFSERALPDFEAEASALRTYEAQVLPGLFQTPDYAAEVFRGGRATDDPDIARKVEARLARQQILSRVKAPHMTAVIDEGALRRSVGTPTIMVEQLEHLENLALRHNIDIQVLPFSSGAHLGMAGSFTIMEFPEARDSPIIYVGTPSDDLYLEQLSDIERYNLTFSNVQGSALSVTASAQFIASLRASMEGEQA
ncbi:MULTISPECIES: helix-turn-helix transcriptional regulator [Nocardiopsis]|uniref:Transcriptional regulator, XRE family n=1 Tax=Nocardiopsis dassonvillei (strain ATCC 23218 / DSM 43111 / CIP 107115 / JCM 7437 / KCTC 9190 / NBRC 14626 / NCTC 10488 / NRRL B-5397 / IMRU 509) TaxID=446468 RepID=D7B4A6_NOCDD|nr:MULTISPECIES: helix-turn-helix transcriptional regulator [Nocardiopsis]ADH68901.1 transcriptional regulator, XRE family [Nocardiopsis dassonvillei subsp. dassonvillei DSM 43111]NKY79785.1 helix-turn-helix domain-containing protein [Nocardiopsis dassonvillei]WDZ89612.1 helix-turn-helix transcriptional regulator [Nocardiopsis sp. HUAS JQ3]VEI89411.1 Helix-turn-helix [Nocardiopsis dassonvillei]